jgi:hypothetical protein
LFAKKLDYLPLVLEQAAAYIAEQEAGFGFADFILPIVYATRMASARLVECWRPVTGGPH